MAGRSRIYFAADVHLGLKVGDPADRETRFVSFLKGIPREEAKALYLLGDIWDFWYEYRDVVPKEGVRVVAQLIDLMDSGVEVYLIPGNHDIWCFHYFESLGVKKVQQPYYVDLGGRTFCLAHGDGLWDPRWRYRFMLSIFRSRWAQFLFSMVHPSLAFRLGNGWSTGNRKTHRPYEWKGAEEPLFRYSVEASLARHADFYLYGHYHVSATETLPDGSRMVVLKDWIDGGQPHAEFNGEDLDVFA